VVSLAVVAAVAVVVVDVFVAVFGCIVSPLDFMITANGISSSSESIGAFTETTLVRCATGVSMAFVAGTCIDTGADVAVAVAVAMGALVVVAMVSAICSISSSFSLIIGLISSSTLPKTIPYLLFSLLIRNLFLALINVFNVNE
jgi:hypothetical protein